MDEIDHDMAHEDISTRLYELESKVEALELKRKKRAKVDISNAVKFSEFKEDFLASEPENRTDPFDDAELVLWFTYIKFKRKLDTERIGSFEELYKRTKGIKIILSHATEIYLSNTTMLIDEDGKVSFPRQWAKDYLEYMAVACTEIPDKKNLSFYYIASQWALNTFWVKSQRYARTKKLDDRPLE